MTESVGVTEDVRASVSAVCPHGDDWSRGDDRRRVSDSINDAKGCDPLSKLVVPPKSLSSDEKLPFMKSHIDWSVENSSRLTGEEPLHDVINAALTKVCDMTREELFAFRTRNMMLVEEWAIDTRVENDRFLSTLDPGVESVLRVTSPDRPANLLLIDKICRYFEVPDGIGTVRDMARGFPLVGDIPTVSSAVPHDVRRKTMSDDELSRLSPSIVAKALKKPVLNDEQKGDLKEIFRQTCDEIAMGRMTKLSEPDTSCPLTMTRRFPVRQLSSKGKMKLRSIDDFLFSRTNDMCQVGAKIRMGKIDDLVLSAKRMTKSGKTDLVIGKSDFRAAYRACPILPEHRRYSRTCVFDPDNDRFYETYQRAMPFGAVGAVYAWDRVGQMAQFVICAVLGLPVHRYVDDLFFVLPRHDAQSVVDQMVRLVSLLGLCLEEEKTPPPAVSQVVLGVELSVKNVSRRDKERVSLAVRLDPNKAAFWTTLLSESLRTQCMPRKVAEKMAGRLGFVAYAILGPIGASRVRYIYAQVLSQGNGSMSQALMNEVSWWKDYLSKNPKVTIRIGPDLPPPAILYTDAEGSGGLGGVLVIDQPGSGRKCLSIMGDAKRMSLPSLKQRKTQIVPYETVAITMSAKKFKRHLLSRDVVLFVDNQTVLSCVKKGRSRVQDLHDLIHETLSVFEACHARVYAYWVPSSLNISDLPSRGDLVPFADLL